MYTDPDSNNPLAWIVPTVIQSIQNYQNAQNRGLSNGQAFGYAATNFVVSGLSSMLNVPGMLPNGALHAGINVMGNGISNSIFGGNFFDNWGAVAISGAVSGGFTGYMMAKSEGLNYWWGSEVKHGRTPWSLSTSEIYRWNVPENPKMATNFDCVPSSLARQSEMFGDAQSKDTFIEWLQYDVNKGYSGLISDFDDYLAERTDYFFTAEQMSISKYKRKLVGSLSNANIPIGYLEKIEGGYYHYSTVKSVIFKNSGKVMVKIADPMGITRSVGSYSGFFFNLNY